MALAPISEKPIGYFVEREFGKHFQYSLNDSTEYPHKLWVTTPREGIDCGWRQARILKTVAYVVIDDGENGLVVEKWQIKNHTNWN